VIRRLDPRFVLIDCEKEREKMSVSNKNMSHHVSFIPRYKCVDGNFTSAALHKEFTHFDLVFNDLTSYMFAHIAGLTFICALPHMQC